MTRRKDARWVQAIQKLRNERNDRENQSRSKGPLLQGLYLWNSRNPPVLRQSIARFAEADSPRPTLVCPPKGNVRPIWGTESYTEDSSICSAAVHAGGISFESGGTVTVEATGPQEIFSASERNGVTSSEWKSWPTSFRVSVDAIEGAPNRTAPLAPATSTLAAVQTINTPGLTVAGMFAPLVTVQKLSTQPLTIAGVFVPLVPTHNITTAMLTIQGQ